MARLSFSTAWAWVLRPSGDRPWQEMNPALPSQDLAKKAEILGVFRCTLARLFADQPGKMVQGGLAIALGVRDAGHGDADGRPGRRASPPSPRGNVVLIYGC